jgi:hypothetical protein
MGQMLTWNKVIIFIVSLSYIFWGAGHINFVWPVMFCLTNALVILTLLIADKDKQQPFHFFCIGIIAAWTFILKQNFGLAIFLANLIFFLIVRKSLKIRIILWYLLGYATIILLQVVYFLCTNSLFAYIQQFYLYTVVKIYQQHILNSLFPWQYPAPFFYQVIKLLFYVSPLIFSVLTIILIVRKHADKWLISIPLISISYYLLSIRPTTDFIHLSPLLALAMPSLGISYQLLQQKRTKLFTTCIVIIFVVLGGYSAFFQHYYRWTTPLIRQNHFISNPHIQLFSDEKEYQNIAEINSFFQKNDPNDHYTFVYAFTPLYYFVLNKQNPTEFDDLQLGGPSPQDQKKIINQLQETHVHYILTDTNLLHDSSLIATFIRKHFTTVKIVTDYFIWKKAS